MILVNSQRSVIHVIYYMYMPIMIHSTATEKRSPSVYNDRVTLP